MNTIKKIIFSLAFLSIIVLLINVVRGGIVPSEDSQKIGVTDEQDSEQEIHLPIISGTQEEAESCPWTTEWPEYASNPFKISTNLPALSGRGGIIVNFFDDDCLLDYAITQKDGDEGEGTARIAVYAHDGSEMWKKEGVSLQMNAEAETYGLPGWSGPGISSGDVDGDGRVEIVHLDTENRVVIRDGSTGNVKKTFPVSLPDGANSWGMVQNVEKAFSINLLNDADNWGMVQVVNLRGQGMQDAILQADPVPFSWLKAIRLDTGETLWSYDSYVGQKHGGFRTADIDADGRDEVLGVTIIDDDGTKMNAWDYPISLNTTDAPHIDAVYAYDVDPGIAGLEIVLLEEGWYFNDEVNSTALVNPDRVIWRKHSDNLEPQNSAIGEFDTSKPGLEIWSRSRFETDQQPWVYDAQGNVIASYVMNDVKPDDWSEKGIEFIYVIDWDGSGQQYIAAKERHVDGKIAVMNPLSGEFIKVWDEVAARIFVADVAGDAREEIVIFNNDTQEIRIYWNSDPGSSSTNRLWQNNYYSRAKDNYNYYSP